MTVLLDDVTIRYGRHTAVDAVSLTFPNGASGLLGQNGAGKSSILKALLGLVRPASGRLQILDVPAGAPGTIVRERVGYMPERDAHLPGMSGFEMVATLGRLSGLPRRDAWRRAHEALYLVGLEEQRYRGVSTYSAGMRQKAKLAAALVHDPEVLFLDEPTNGLDPDGRTEMLDLIRSLCTRHGKSVVLSTHILQDVEAVCEHVVVLAAGRVVAAGSIRELTQVAERRVAFAVEPRELDLTPHVEASVRLHPDGAGRWIATLPAELPLQMLYRAVLAAGGCVRQLQEARRTLEDTFLQVVDAAAEPGPEVLTADARAGDRAPSRGTPSNGATP